MKQTAVEWLDEQIQERVISQDTIARKIIIEFSIEDYIDLKKQAKQMEREQIEAACEFGRKSPHITGDQYYFCTYIDND